MRRPWEVVTDNPIFVRELRRRMRGKAMIVSMITYVIAMCIASFIIIFAVQLTSNLPPQKIAERIGSLMFHFVTVIQAFLVLLAAPSITAGTTTSERERQTFEFLQVTTLSARGFVFGNLLSTILYVLLVLVCALPIMSLTFLYGGIGLDDVLATFGVLLLFSVLLSSLALFASAVHNKTRGVQALVTILCVVVGFILWMQNLLFPSMIALSGGSTFTGLSFSVLGWTIPSWVPVAFVVLTVSMAFIVAAGRKLYVPENRLFNYRQAFVFFAILQGICLAAMWGQMVESRFSVWLIFSAICLYFSAMIFSTGRLEIGDEVWIAKRRHRLLRGMDEGLAFMVAMLLLLGATGWVWNQAVPASAGRLPVRQLASILGYVAGATIMIFYTGRAISQVAYTRSGAFRMLLAVVVVGCLVPPLFGAMFYSGMFSNDFGAFMVDLSPLGGVMSYPGNLKDVSWRVPPVLACYGVVAGVGFLVWASASKRRRAVNYHFELKG